MQYLSKPLKAKFVVVKTVTYFEIVQSLLAVKVFPNLPTDPTDKYHKLINTVLQQ